MCSIDRGLAARGDRLSTVESRELKDAVDGDLTADLYRHGSTTVVLIVAFWLFLHMVLGSETDDGTAVDWVLDFALMLIVLRWGADLLLARTGSVRGRFWVFTALTASIGIAYGVVNFLSYSRAGPIPIVILATCQVAITSLALVSLAGSIVAFLLFALPNVGVLVVLAAIFPLPGPGEVFALMLALYIVCLVMMHAFIHSSVKEGFVLRRRLTQLAMRDPLTGLPNRRHVTEFMPSDASLAVRTAIAGSRASKGAPYRFQMMMLDLDQFKTVNDSYGHETGDRVLVEVGRTIRAALREEDIVARWGGEEFLVIARNIEGPSADVSARLRLAIARARIESGSKPVLSLTCSIGSAVFPFSEDRPALFSWKDVLALADRCLYYAKENGRNRSVGIAAGEEFGSLPDAAALLEIDLDEARRRGWIRFLDDAGAGGGLWQAS